MNLLTRAELDNQHAKILRDEARLQASFRARAERKDKAATWRRLARKRETDSMRWHYYMACARQAVRGEIA